ncbi:MAG: type VI secretion system baseplate subunit TssF [bacterium]
MRRSYNQYYQDELTFLREMGKEFAEKHPAIAHFIAEVGSDPDVERLLEGFAFLTGRLRQKLDDELPELTHSMMGLLWPHYLRPIPSMAILEFEPQRTLRGAYIIPRIKTEVESSPIGGTKCRFRTCYDVELLPISIDDAALEGNQIRIKFRLLNGVQFQALNINKIRLRIHGDPLVQYALYLKLCKHIQRIVIRAENGNNITLDQSNIKPVGFSDDDALLPYPTNSFIGYRVLQEYFSFPEKFMFIDLTGIERAYGLGIQETFEVIFYFSKKPDESLRVTKDNFHVNCTPIINLFPRESEPIRVEHNRTEYRLRPEGPNYQNYEIYSVDRVSGLIQGTVQQYEYEPFYSFKHSVPNQNSVYYYTHLRSSVTNETSTETYISFVNSEQSFVLPPTETVVANLTCINCQITAQIRLGEIRNPTSSSPEVAKFRNITNVTPTIYPPLGGRLHWKLISHLALNRLSIASKEALVGILSLYNFQSSSDRKSASENERRLDGIVNVSSEPKDRLYLGLPIRGTEVFIELRENHFSGEGDLYLFASVLNEFLSLYTDINSFIHLTAKGAEFGEIYTWPLRVGRQSLL